MRRRGVRPHGVALALAFGAALALVLVPAVASAGPSIWARVREPALDRREELLAEAEALQLKAKRVQATTAEDIGEALADAYLRRAKELMELAGAATSRDLGIRFRLAEVYHELRDSPRAAKLLETIVRADPPASIRAEANADLAICYAYLGRYAEEISAYGEALAVEPHPLARSTLLANRAEAYMLTGDITASVQGYRDALVLLTPIEMFMVGPTTLWGLAVALDRSGDLDSALEAVRLARTYDPGDRRINGHGWFYVPAYDKHYYQALGYWSMARAADVGAARATWYERAIEALEAFEAQARPEDRWLEHARARLRACKKERDAFVKRTVAPARRGAGKGAARKGGRGTTDRPPGGDGAGAGDEP